MIRYEITGNKVIEVKRLYLPIIIEVECNVCEAVNQLDFGEDYLSYPTTNKSVPVSVFCYSCDEYFDVNVALKIALEVDQT